MVINLVWLGFFLVAITTACMRFALGDAEVFARLVAALFDAARSGFDIAIGLTGVMSLWLGFLKVGERAGLVEALARRAAPLLRALFPGVPAGHPAQAAMTMNLSANLLGLDNAATPLGLQAMRELQSINPSPHTASDAQIMFMVLNTAGLTLVPTSVIAIRQTIALQQKVPHFDAAAIFLPTLLATGASCLAGFLAVAVCQRLPLWKPRWWIPLLALVLTGAAVLAGLSRLPPALAAQAAGVAGSACILGLVAVFLCVGAWRRVPVYDVFVEGAKEGFGVAIQIVPYLVAMLCAIGMFRAAGCMDAVLGAIGAGVAWLGLDTAFLPALPVGLMKILSGSGARALMVDVMTTYGVDSFPARLAAIVQGSTETTFYVLAVYSGAAGLRNTRHALGCALVADVAGLVAAIFIGYAFFT
jgi:spore maturation protein SpmA